MVEEEMGPRQKAARTKRERTRELIVVSTLELYDGKTEGDYTRDEIAAAAGVGVATLHNNFGSKYEVLRAAYDRLLSPVVDTIIEGNKAGVYHPKDGVDELLRYVYTVARVSQNNRALTVALVKSYYDTPPELDRSERLVTQTDRLLGGRIAEGLQPIFKTKTFVPQSEEENWKSLERGDMPLEPSTLLYHSQGFLTSLFHTNSAYQTTHQVCVALLSVARPGPWWLYVSRQLEPIMKQVDASA
ncbi:TetR/AcrR family transcriptional regulator [Streptomyces sp. NPDC060002]|uniref:TetR/AcrR family transcriptional regulator n=1 Tax=Streptomyces sp. NPDC060002 TaxID=3347033 RepID=UPI0036C9CC16